jgi:hypothetical protein
MKIVLAPVSLRIITPPFHQRDMCLCVCPSTKYRPDLTFRMSDNCQRFSPFHLDWVICLFYNICTVWSLIMDRREWRCNGCSQCNFPPCFTYCASPQGVALHWLDMLPCLHSKVVFNSASAADYYWISSAICRWMNGLLFHWANQRCTHHIIKNRGTWLQQN